MLLEALRTGQAESVLNEEDRNHLYQYKSTLQKLDAQLYEETTKNKKSPDDLLLKSLQKQLADTRRQYEALIRSFETHYPSYYNIKFGQKFAQLRDIQNLLPNDNSQVALEYFVGERTVYTFLVSKNDCQVVKKDKPKDFEMRIDLMRRALFYDDEMHRKEFIDQASWLYDVVLRAPLRLPDAQKATRLLIIPDGSLNYVSFDMLFDRDALPPVTDFGYGISDFGKCTASTEIRHHKSEIHKTPQYGRA